eukprot:TRINITY_DN2248_c5_g1_i1.p1 TRINITY_DN2248_c5_g1~~TRINITY_DN2248_c5_g1_i1.p1  ORF type:complete len:194 (+),score=52.89 TRINITY_DN2248_c5_g1_i1:53-634(+)
MSHKHFSIWLVPKENYQLLESTINDFSDTRNTVKFSPHLTLLGGLRGSDIEEKIIIDNLNELCENNKNIQLKLCPINDSSFIQRGQTVHQCVYCVMEKNNEELTKLYKECLELNKPLYNSSEEINVDEKFEQYLCHLSLIYGDLSEEERDQVIEEASEKLNFDNLCFNIDKIILYDTTSRNEEEWFGIKTFDL